MTVTPVQATAAIPLMAADGVTAVNTAANYRQGFIGAMASPAPGGPMTWRSGVIPSTTVTSPVSAVRDLLGAAAVPASSSMTVAAGSCIIVRSGALGGPYLVNFASAVPLGPLDPNPTSNSRYDVVYIQLIDAALSDTGTQGAQIAVVSGTASATPVVPSIPTGAIPICSILRPSFASNGSTNNITSSQITDLRKSAVLGYGVRTLTPGDSVTDAGAYAGELTYDFVSAVQSGLRIWDGFRWRGLQPRIYTGTNALSLNTQYSGGTGDPSTNVTPFTISIPDPGFGYRLRTSGKMGGSTLTNSLHWQIQVNGSVHATVYANSGSIFDVGFPSKTTSGVIFGASTVKMVSVWDYPSCSFYTSVADTDMWMEVEVVPA